MYNQGPGVSPPKPHTFLPGPLWHARFSHEKKKKLQGLDVPLTETAKPRSWFPTSWNAPVPWRYLAMIRMETGTVCNSRADMERKLQLKAWNQMACVMLWQFRLKCVHHVKLHDMLILINGSEDKDSKDLRATQNALAANVQSRCVASFLVARAQYFGSPWNDAGNIEASWVGWIWIWQISAVSSEVIEPKVLLKAGTKRRPHLRLDRRLCGVLAPRARMLPMLLAGLSSKSKRPVAQSIQGFKGSNISRSWDHEICSFWKCKMKWWWYTESVSQH